MFGINNFSYLSTFIKNFSFYETRVIRQTRVKNMEYQRARRIVSTKRLKHVKIEDTVIVVFL